MLRVHRDRSNPFESGHDAFAHASLRAACGRALGDGRSGPRPSVGRMTRSASYGLMHRGKWCTRVAERHRKRRWNEKLLPLKSREGQNRVGARTRACTCTARWAVNSCSSTLGLHVRGPQTLAPLNGPLRIIHVIPLDTITIAPHDRQTQKIQPSTAYRLTRGWSRDCEPIGGGQDCAPIDNLHHHPPRPALPNLVNPNSERATACPNFYGVPASRIPSTAITATHSRAQE